MNEEDEKKFFGIPIGKDLPKDIINSVTRKVIKKIKNEENKNILISDISPQSQFWNKLLISHDSKLKYSFDILILILTAFSCLQILYVLSFDGNQINMKFAHYVIEGFLVLSIILAFFHKHQDPETLEIISSYKLIAWKYIFKGWFIIDILSILPYELFISSSKCHLIRLIRLPKLLTFLQVSWFDNIIESFFSGSDNNQIIIMFNLRYIFKIIRLILFAMFMTYLIGCSWYFFCNNMRDKNDSDNFIKHYSLENNSPFERFIISCYFALTTLTTVGYGDYVAWNNKERIFAIFIMLLGVALFSYVMGSFTELISSYDKKIGATDKGSDLQNWLSLLTKFSKNKPFDSDLIKKIDNHFNYFWKNDRNALIKKDNPYLSALPQRLKIKLMEILWADVFDKFSNFFLYYTGNKKRFFKFYHDISYCLLPRRFLPGDTIYTPKTDIEEMYLILEGQVDIGYSLHNSLDKVNYCKIIEGIDWIGEFYCMFNVRSNYFYTANNQVKTFGINKYDLLTCLDKHESLYNKLRSKAYRRYHDYIKEIMEKNIDEEIQHFNIKHNTFKINKMDPTFEIGSHENGLRINRIIQNRMDNKNLEIQNLIDQIENKFVKLDDDYTNLSKYLYDLTSDFNKNLTNMNSVLDKLNITGNQNENNIHVDVIKS